MQWLEICVETDGVPDVLCAELEALGVEGLVIEDEADFAGGERFLALGTACEFALMEGMFDRAAELDVRYKDALAAAGKSRGGRMRERRWA